MIEQAQEGERKRDGSGEAREKKPELRERESRRRKENAPCLGNTFTLVSRAFVNTPWGASAPGD